MTQGGLRREDGELTRARLRDGIPTVFLSHAGIALVQGRTGLKTTAEQGEQPGRAIDFHRALGPLRKIGLDSASEPHLGRAN